MGRKLVPMFRVGTHCPDVPSLFLLQDAGSRLRFRNYSLWQVRRDYDLSISSPRGTRLTITVMIRIAYDLMEHEPMYIGSQHSDRFMLWIDAVGGYLVCLGDEIVLGQPDQGGGVDVPIFGDLGSRHALIRREGKGYTIEAPSEVSVDDRPLRGPCRLRDGSRIRLGESVRLLFRRPHALSGTARLDFLSPHRTQPSTDAVLLMADTCVLGPGLRSHVVCRGWTRDVLLYRRQRELYCHSDGPLKIEGMIRDGSGRIDHNSRVEGDGLSFNLEAI